MKIINYKTIAILSLLVFVFLLGFSFSVQAYRISQQELNSPVSRYLRENYGVDSIEEYRAKFEQETWLNISRQMEALASEYSGLGFDEWQSLDVYRQYGTSSYQPPKIASQLPFYMAIFSEPVTALQVFSLSGLGLIGLAAVPPVRKSKRLKQVLVLGVVVLCVFSIGYFVGLTAAQTGTITIEPGSFTETASYVVWTDGTTVYAKNGKTGQVEYSGTNAPQVIQYAINMTNALGGGKVLLKAGSYYLPYHQYIYLKDNVVLEGEGTATKLFMESNNLQVISVKDVAVRNLYIAPYGAAESAKNTGSPSDATVKIVVSGTDVSPAQRVSIENVVMEGERAILEIGPWSKATTTPVVYDLTVKGCRFTKAGNSAYPSGNMQIHYVERAWIQSNYFRSRDYTTVTLDPSKPWSVHPAYTRFMWFVNNIIDGSHHNNISGQNNSYTFYIGNVFRYSDDAIDTINSDHQHVIGNYVENDGSLASFEGTSSDIIVAHNTGYNIGMAMLTNATRVTIKGNIVDGTDIIYNQGQLEDVIIEGNRVRLTRYVFRNPSPMLKLRMINNIIDLAGDDRIWLGDDSGTSSDIEIAYNEFLGVNTGSDICFYVGRYDSGTGTKYYWAQYVRIHHNTFRRCRYMLVYSFLDSKVYVWENTNLGYLDGGSSDIRLLALDQGLAYYRISQSNIRMTASFDASVLGAQTQSINNYMCLLPQKDTSYYVALCSIRSAPSGWVGYAMCKVDTTYSYNTVDVTLVTTTNATGTVYVDVVLMEAEPQGGGYYQTKEPRWHR